MPALHWEKEEDSEILAVETTLQQRTNYNHVSCIFPISPWLCHLQCTQICADLEVLLRLQGAPASPLSHLAALLSDLL